MNSETSTSSFPTTDTGLNGSGSDTEKSLHAFTQKIHDAVDSLEQRIGNGSDKVMGLQQEYGEAARDEVRAHPLAAVGIAFAVGFLLAKITR